MTPQPIPGGEAGREAGLAPPQSRRERARHAFRLASAYWTSADWKFAWGATVILVILQFTGAYVFVASNRWQQAFFDSVEKKELARFVPLVLAFGGIMLWQVGQSLVSTYIGMNLAMRWRTFLTERYLHRWMAHNRFAEIERLRLIDNPDQRIAEDIGKVTGPTLANYSSGIFFVALGFIGQTVGAITFIGILMETAEPIRLTVAGRSLSIPGSTVWYAFLYAFLGSYLMVLIGKPYIRARMRQQHCEADFRTGLIHVRRNAAQIGFVGAVALEQASLAQSFSHIRRNYRSIIFTLMGIQTGQGIYQRIGSMVPLFLMVPRYFAGAFSFGQMMGARDAFETLVSQLSYFIQSYSGIGEQIANLNRIKALDDALDHHRPRGIGFSVGAAAGTAMTATGLHLMRPHGAPLLDIADWRIANGERWVVQGPSGAGKSTLLRAMAGLWPDGRGAVTMTDQGTVMFVPQRLYLPMGTLKATICFPDASETHDDAAILALLERVRLSDHAGQLHEVRVWQEELSPGEQQRIALARILLHRPTLLVLDEATSALDRDNARYFHEQLLGDLPGVTLVSVVHDDRLRPFHTHCLTIANGQATPSRLPGDSR